MGALLLIKRLVSQNIDKSYFIIVFMSSAACVTATVRIENRALFFNYELIFRIYVGYWELLHCAIFV